METDCTCHGCPQWVVSRMIRMVVLDSLRGSSVKLGTIQIISAWPLRKDDTHTHTHTTDPYGCIVGKVL